MKEACIKYVNQITDFIDTAGPTTDSLFGGELAVSLYYFYLYETTGNESYAAKAVERLEKVMIAFNNNEARLFGSYYCNGLSGLFYLLVLYVKKGVLGDGMHEELKMLASQLLAGALKGIDDDYNDFAHGSFGTLHCLILHAELFNDHQFLIPFLQKIEERYLLAEQDWIPSYIIKKIELVTVNFSLAHGQPGQLILLMRAYKLTGITSQVKGALKRHIDYVIDHKSENPIDNTCNYFPSMLYPVTDLYKTTERLAWCYSDFGQILLLYEAADFFGNGDYAQLAEKVGSQTLNRTTYETTKLNSAQICHGTSGVAEIYYSLWKKTGLNDYRNAGDFWIGQSLEHLEAELAAASSAFQVDIIEGLPGVGLSLMSYITNNELDWSSLILL